MSPTLSSNSETIDRTRINERIKIHFFEMEMENLPTSRRRAFIIMNPIDAEFEFQIWKSNVLGWGWIPFVYRQYVANVWQIQHIATGYRTWKMFPHIFLRHSREQFGQSVSHVIHCGSITQTCMNVIKNRRYMKKKKNFFHARSSNKGSTFGLTTSFLSRLLSPKSTMYSIKYFTYCISVVTLSAIRLNNSILSPYSSQMSAIQITWEIV